MICDVNEMPAPKIKLFLTQQFSISDMCARGIMSAHWLFRMKVGLGEVEG